MKTALYYVGYWLRTWRCVLLCHDWLLIRANAAKDSRFLCRRTSCCAADRVET